MDGEGKDIYPRGVKRVVEETTPTVTINKRIQSLIDSHLVYNGQVSGRHYEWMRAGAIVDVDEQDVPELLGKQMNKSCCGQGNKLIFQLAD